MKNIFDYLSKNLDKVAHVLVCTLIVVVVAFADMDIWHRDVWTAVGIGVTTAVILGFLKEVADFFRGRGVDPRDLKADFLGAVTGAVIVVLEKLLA